MEQRNSHRRDANLQRVVDLDRLSWDDLRLFIVTARHSSFRKAAALLRISSTTIPRRIERLERQLGYRLFTRLSDGVQLTREGSNVLKAAQQMEQASLSLRRQLDQDVTSRGTIRCNVTEGLGTFWMLPKLVDFNRSNPFTVVDLRCTMAYSDVARLETDVAVQLTRPTNADLKVVKLGRMHIYPFASRRYLDTFGQPTSREDLSQHRLVEQISPQLPDGILASVLGLDSIEGVVAVKTNLSSAHFYAVELGIGIGMLPTYAIPLGADVVPLDIGIQREIDIWLTYHASVRDVPRVGLFIDWVRSIFDPVRYPWFGDEFVHPLAFSGWMPAQADPNFGRASGVATRPSGPESRNGSDRFRTPMRRGVSGPRESDRQAVSTVGPRG